MKKTKKFISLICAVLMLSFVLNPTTSSAKTKKGDDHEVLVFNEEALEALEKSVYINTVTRTAHIDIEKALSYYSFTDAELNLIQAKLDNLTKNEIQEMINYATADADKSMQIQVAPVIIWGGIAILGLFTGAALYFSSKYMTYKEKQNLINRCYDMGGTPVIESGDTGGLGGAVKKAWWKMTNTYKFECVK